jgi:hypothetical protein
MNSSNSILDQLKLSEPRQHQRGSVEQQCRDRIVQALTEQLLLVHADLENREHTLTVRRYLSGDNGLRQAHDVRKRVRKWYWPDPSGVWFMEMRYGNRPLQLAQGKSTIEIGGREQLRSTIEKLIDAVRLGELDGALKNAWTERRKILKRKQTVKA